MKNISPRVNWLGLYLLVIFILGGFFLEARAPLSADAHKIAQIAILLPGFGLIYLWLSINEGGFVAADKEEQRQARRQTVKELLERNNLRSRQPSRAVVPEPSRWAWLKTLVTGILGFFHF